MSDSTSIEIEKELITHETRNRLFRALGMSLHEKSESSQLGYNITTVNVILRTRGKHTFTHDGDIIPEELMYISSLKNSAFSANSSVEICNILCELILNNIMDHETVNAILESGNCSFHILNDEGFPYIELIEEVDFEGTNSNAPESIRLVHDRMTYAFKQGDYGGVLHAAASIGEAIAKSQTSNPNVENQPLGGWVQQFKNTSRLPTALNDLIEEVYQNRNVIPNAGHGSMSDSGVSKNDAAEVMCIMSAALRLNTILQST